MVAKPKNVAEASLQCGQGVSMYSLPHDDSWLRDNGPSFVVDASRRRRRRVLEVERLGRALSPTHDRDAAVAEALLNHLEMRRYDAPLVLEGGAHRCRRRGHGARHRIDAAQSEPQSRAGSRAEIERDAVGLSRRPQESSGCRRAWRRPTGESPIDNVACFARPGVVLALGLPMTAPMPITVRSRTIRCAPAQRNRRHRPRARGDDDRAAARPLHGERRAAADALLCQTATSPMAP